VLKRSYEGGIAGRNKEWLAKWGEKDLPALIRWETTLGVNDWTYLLVDRALVVLAGYSIGVQSRRALWYLSLPVLKILLAISHGYPPREKYHGADLISWSYDGEVSLSDSLSKLPRLKVRLPSVVPLGFNSRKVFLSRDTNIFHNRYLRAGIAESAAILLVVWIYLKSKCRHWISS